MRSFWPRSSSIGGATRVDAALRAAAEFEPDSAPPEELVERAVARLRRTELDRREPIPRTRGLTLALATVFSAVVVAAGASALGRLLGGPSAELATGANVGAPLVVEAGRTVAAPQSSSGAGNSARIDLQQVRLATEVGSEPAHTPPLAGSVPAASNGTVRPRRRFGGPMRLRSAVAVANWENVVVPEVPLSGPAAAVLVQSDEETGGWIISTGMVEPTAASQATSMPGGPVPGGRSEE
jgi:hypothetical protein